MLLKHPLARFAMTLAIAGVGGALFAAAGLPLPWMLGAMTAVTLATVCRFPAYVPRKVRPPMTAVIGVLLGAGFHPDLAGQVFGWLPSILGLLIFTVIAGAACTTYLLVIARMDPVTAYFSGMPGGLVEMVEVGRDQGGHEMTIALMHAARILLVVMTLPFLVQTIEGTSIASGPEVGLHVWDAPVSTYLQLAGCAVAGVYLGAWLKLPAHNMLGPMLVSAVLHLVGLTTFVPPIEVVQGAQLALGAILGSRFAAAEPREILRILRIAAGMAIVMISTVGLVATAMATLTGRSATTLILAYSPGGLTEMGLVALAIGADIAFVAAHHLIRVVLVMMVAGPIFVLAYGGPKENQQDPRRAPPQQSRRP